MGKYRLIQGLSVGFVINLLLPEGTEFFFVVPEAK